MTEGSKEGRKERRKAQVGKDRDATVGNLDSLRFRVKKISKKLSGGSSRRLDRKEKVETRAMVSHGRDFFSPIEHRLGRPHPVLIVTKNRVATTLSLPAAFSRGKLGTRAGRSGRSEVQESARALSRSCGRHDWKKRSTPRRV